MKTIALVLFDLDGVLIDSRANMQSAWCAVQEGCGWDTPFEDYFAQIGLPFRAILDSLGLHTQHDLAERLYRERSIATFHQVRVYPGIQALLRRLSRESLATGIVTSKDASRTALAVELLATPFAVIQPPMPHLRGKPEPDQLLAATAALRIPVDATVYVGDMAVDAQSADRAGLAYVHAGWGYGAAPADAVVAPSPAALFDAVTTVRSAA